LSLSPLPAALAASVLPFLFNLLGALALWVGGGWLIRFGARLLRQAMRHSSLDPTMAGYLVNFIAVILRVILVVAILGFFGIPTASFAALLAGAGVAIGAAWSGMLGNFAAGVFLQMFRPFSVGDVICAAGVTGTVEEIGMFMSSILAVDHVRNIVPNSKLFGDTIQNFSSHVYRRVDLTLQLDQGADVDRAIDVIRAALQGIDHQVAGLAPELVVLEINAWGPKLAVRPYALSSHFVQVRAECNRILAELIRGGDLPVARGPLEHLADHYRSHG
jgi:small conductance mechanosensitive channel